MYNTRTERGKNHEERTDRWKNLRRTDYEKEISDGNSFEGEEENMHSEIREICEKKNGEKSRDGGSRMMRKGAKRGASA